MTWIQSSNGELALESQDGILCTWQQRLHLWPFARTPIMSLSFMIVLLKTSTSDVWQKHAHSEPLSGLATMGFILQLWCLLNDDAKMS